MSEALLNRQIDRERAYSDVLRQRTAHHQPLAESLADAPVSGASFPVSSKVAKEVALVRRENQHEFNVNKGMEHHKKSRMPQEYEKEIVAAMKIARKTLGSRKNGNPEEVKIKNMKTKGRKKASQRRAKAKASEEKELSKFTDE